MHHGVVVAMQVEHHVGVERQALQREPLRFELGARLLLVERLAHRRAHGQQVLRRVLAQPALDARHHQRGQVVEVAVEVLHGVQLEAAEMVAEHVLGQADRIRHRHHHDFVAQPPGRLERREMAAQQGRDEHAGQFVGMQRRLDIDLLPAARTVMEAGDVAFGAERGGNQRMGQRLHDRGAGGLGRRAESSGTGKRRLYVARGKRGRRADDPGRAARALARAGTCRANDNGPRRARRLPRRGGIYLP